ncbi:CFI-box-CTERM domain-containing protein [Niabella ginsengisoli]|uniref:Uncharacterized protein n=1 Tax=Niabella ginsengisoli TaxID=522298 RepID=A0ABS9SQD4_9BACT|nr:CFI-box-CTERM domain-containing protein [Niabella ginsengisoli]MCH5600456.1 hypothetical protein [Niabella ginsengisoli]
MYVEKVVPPEAFKKREGCFIATVCYGDYNAAEVLALRRYRDEVMLKTAMGKAFVRLYYAVSPALASVIERSAFLKTNIRNYILRPLVKELQR